jgi:hypothetical protein
MIGVPGVDTFGFNLVDISGTFKQQLDQVATDTKLDIKQEDTGPIKLEIQKLKDALAKHEAFNKQILPIINKLEASAPNSSSAISQPNINTTTPNFAANNQYSIFVFYREARAADSKALVSGLIAAGFQTFGIMATLEEAQIGPQSDGSTFIIPTDKGKTIGDAVQQIASGSAAPTKWGSNPRRPFAACTRGYSSPALLAQCALVESRSRSIVLFKQGLAQASCVGREENRHPSSPT